MTRKKELFQPIEANKVKMYVCGPTVYNYIHIGNARPAVVFDTVRRYLEYRKYAVDYVLNFTDVDDKLIHAAKAEKTDVLTLSERYIAAYKADTASLGVKEATHYPRVTETMPEIIAFIDALMAKGFAYDVAGDVYFRVRKYEDYGKLSHQSLDDLRSGARIDVDQRKEDPLDFALWKGAKADELSWDAPWGKGRPGWHIECSAMAKAYLGETIDIHAGGQDLAFPHHENEIAQSESCNNHPFANYWLHNGYINIEDEKMSKSIGNVVLTRELLEQFDGSLIRYFMLSVHYRSPINFSMGLLDQAKAGFHRLKTAYQRAQEALPGLESGEDSAVTANVVKLREDFEAAMDDDFNTANAMAVLFDLAKQINLYLKNTKPVALDLNAYLGLFDEILQVLGFSFEQEQALLDEDIEGLLEEREIARKNRNFKRADELRDQLVDKGILLEDTAEGTRWKRG